MSATNMAIHCCCLYFESGIPTLKKVLLLPFLKSFLNITCTHSWHRNAFVLSGFYCFMLNKTTPVLGSVNYHQIRTFMKAWNNPEQNKNGLNAASDRTTGGFGRATGETVIQALTVRQRWPYYRSDSSTASNRNTSYDRNTGVRWGVVVPKINK